MELITPAELEACLGEGIIADSGTGVALGQIGGMGSNLIGDDTRTHTYGESLPDGAAADSGNPYTIMATRFP